MNNGKQSHSISFSTPDTGYQKLFEFFFIINLQNSLICHAFNTDLVLSLFLSFSENVPVSLNDLKIFRQKFKAMFLCSVKKPLFLVLKRTMSFYFSPFSRRACHTSCRICHQFKMPPGVIFYPFQKWCVIFRLIGILVIRETIPAHSNAKIRPVRA